MNILYLTTNPNLGSTARVLQSWLTRGAAFGVRGMLAIREQGPLSEWARDRGVPHVVDSMPLPDRARPLPSVRSAWRIARQAWKAGVDIIHCNEHDIYPFASLLRRFLRRPLVCHVRFTLGRPYYEWIFAKGKRRPDALCWTSRWQMAEGYEHVRGFVPESRQHLIHLGIDLETFGRHPETRDATRAAWGIGPDDMVIGTASAMKPVKRIEDFIRVVADVARTDRRVVGVIAGRVPKGYEEYHETLRREANATGLAARFRWVGHLEPIEPFHHACDVFVSTSECETFGNSVCEAMACSRPVLAYEGGSVQEVVASTGRIVPTGDLAGLKASLRELLDDPAMRRRMGESARNRVAEHFQPKSSLEKLTRVYRSLLGEGDNRTPRGAHAIRSLHSKCDN